MSGNKAPITHTHTCANLFICVLKIQDFTMNIYENADYGISPKWAAANKKLFRYNNLHPVR